MGASPCSRKLPAPDKCLGPHISCCRLSWYFLEASPGIEPGYKDLQSSASPLRHEASLHRSVLQDEVHEPWLVPVGGARPATRGDLE